MRDLRNMSKDAVLALIKSRLDLEQIYDNITDTQYFLQNLLPIALEVAKADVEVQNDIDVWWQHFCKFKEMPNNFHFKLDVATSNVQGRLMYELERENNRLQTILGGTENPSLDNLMKERKKLIQAHEDFELYEPSIEKLIIEQAKLLKLLQIEQQHLKKYEEHFKSREKNWGKEATSARHEQGKHMLQYRFFSDSQVVTFPTQLPAWREERDEKGQTTFTGLFIPINSLSSDYAMIRNQPHIGPLFSWNKKTGKTETEESRAVTAPNSSISFTNTRNTEN